MRPRPPIGVARIRHHRERIGFHCLLRCSCHRIQQPIVSRLTRYFMMDDETGLDVDRRLNVIGRRFAARAHTHGSGVRLALDQRCAVFRLQHRRQRGESGPPRLELDQRLRRALRVPIISFSRVNGVQVG
jgi:hypothetical protein